MPLSQDLEEIAKKYPKHSRDFEQKMKSLRISEVLLSLKDHDGMKMLEDIAKHKIEAINSKLLSNDFLSEQERGILISERNVWRWLVSIFPNAQTNIESIEKFTKNYG